jgi:hypothetical protein
MQRVDKPGGTTEVDLQIYKIGILIVVHRNPRRKNVDPRLGYD